MISRFIICPKVGLYTHYGWHDMFRVDILSAFLTFMDIFVVLHMLHLSQPLNSPHVGYPVICCSSRGTRSDMVHRFRWYLPSQSMVVSWNRGTPNSWMVFARGNPNLIAGWWLGVYSIYGNLHMIIDNSRDFPLKNRCITHKNYQPR